MAPRRFFIDPGAVQGGAPAVTGPDADHIRKVLRLTPGAEIALFDGTGTSYRAAIRRITPGAVSVEILETTAGVGESPLSITLAQGLLKDRKMDDLIRPITELGIARLIPFRCARSVPVPDARRMASRLERWEKLAREAVKQCGRSRPPAIDPVAGFDKVLAAAGGLDGGVLFWEGEEAPVDLLDHPLVGAGPRSLLVLVGPEGGFTAAEARRASEAGCLRATLGPRILRAETAAVAACALVQYLFGDLSRKNA